MFVAQCFNETEGKPTAVVFGSVTNGNEWVFLKLENNILYIDPSRFSLESHSLPTLLGALQMIVEQFRNKHIYEMPSDDLFRGYFCFINL